MGIGKLIDLLRRYFVKDKKIYIISHIDDTDGLMPVVLSKLVFKDVEYKLTIPTEVDMCVKNVIENQELYDYIFIVDLNISDELCEIIEKDNRLNKKIKVFDHHISAIEKNRFSFETVIDLNEQGNHECGTSLFYKYLLTIPDNFLLTKKVTADIVELIRQIDTWDFKKTNNKNAIFFGQLLNIYGPIGFIEHFYEYIQKHEAFEFSETEKFILELEQRKIDEYISKKVKEMIKIELDGKVVGIVFAELNRSLLGHTLCDMYEIDYAIVINLSHGLSFRARDEDDIDVSIIAHKYLGGGHKKASGAPLPLKIEEKIISLIFENARIIGDEICK